MKNQDETFLVTGAAGCIGAWTIRLLLEQGASVIATDLSEDERRRVLATGLRALAALDDLAVR